MYTGELKSFKEAFPEIDLGIFEAIRSLNEDTYNIVITVNNARFDLKLVGKTFRIKSTEEIEDETIYTCFITVERLHESYKMYGKWFKNIREESPIPFKEESINILKEIEKNENKNRIY